MIPTPPGWRLSHRGDALRRRSGPAGLRVYRERDRGGYFVTIEMRLDFRDPAEACALRAGVAGASRATARAIAGVHSAGRAAAPSSRAGARTRSVRASGQEPPADPLSREIFAKYSAHACATVNLQDG